MRRYAVATTAACALAVALTGCAPQRAAAPAREAGAGARAPAPQVSGPHAESELLPFVSQDTRLHLSAHGDLDADGDLDALMVLDDGREDSANTPRTLLLLQRGADGRLQTAVRSPRAILCRRCGGMVGDPLQGMRVEPGEFILRFEGGSRELWSSEFRFAYSDSTGGWRLQQVVHGGFDRANGKQAEHALAPDDIGEVMLADFDASDFPADALP